MEESPRHCQILGTALRADTQRGDAGGMRARSCGILSGRFERRDLGDTWDILSGSCVASGGVTDLAQVGPPADRTSAIPEFRPGGISEIKLSLVVRLEGHAAEAQLSEWRAANIARTTGRVQRGEYVRTFTTYCLPGMRVGGRASQRCASTPNSRWRFRVLRGRSSITAGGSRCAGSSRRFRLASPMAYEVQTGDDGLGASDGRPREHPPLVFRRCRCRS